MNGSPHVTTLPSVSIAAKPPCHDTASDLVCGEAPCELWHGKPNAVGRLHNMVWYVALLALGTNVHLGKVDALTNVNKACCCLRMKALCQYYDLCLYFIDEQMNRLSVYVPAYYEVLCI